MKKLPSLSVFFPVYNDGEIIPYIVAKTYAILPTVAKQFEVILVDDGSDKKTAAILALLKNQYSRLRVITHPKNRGYGGALQTGFRNCSYAWIFYTDSDGQYDMTEIIQLVKKISGKVDVVNGYKIGRSDGLVRKFIGAIYNWFVHRLYHLPIRDVDCDFRLIRAAKIKQISLRSLSGTICLELVEKLASQHALFKEVPVHHYKRIIGTSRFFRPTHLFRMLRENIVYFRNRRLLVPSDRIELSTKRL